MSFSATQRVVPPPMPTGGHEPDTSLTDRTEDIVVGSVTQSEDIPDSGTHLLEGVDGGEGEHEISARVGGALEGWRRSDELCRGASRVWRDRQAGYVRLRRFRESKHDPEVATERSRRLHTTPTKVLEAVKELVVEARKAHSTWGPKKLCAWLRHHVPQLASRNSQCRLRAPQVRP